MGQRAKQVIVALVSLLVLLPGACSLSPVIGQQGEFAAGAVSIAWSMPYPDNGEAYVNTYCTLWGNHLYQTLVGNKLISINLDSHSPEWVKSTTVRTDTDAVVIDGQLYMIEHYADWADDQLTTRPARILRTGADASSPVQQLTMTFGAVAMTDQSYKLNEHGGKLYWGSFNTQGVSYGLIALDPFRDVARVRDTFFATPRVLYPTVYDIFTNIVFYRDLAIFVGIDRTEWGGGIPADRKYYSVFAVDVATGELVWTQVPQHGYAAAYPGCLQLYRDRLFIFTMQGAACLNPSDGTILWDTKEVTGGDIAGPLFDGDRVYVTNQGYGPTFQERGLWMIVCAEVATGAVIWRDFYPETTFGTNPQRYGSRLFVPTSGSILVYDADTGRRLYQDKNWWGDGYQLNRCERYGDLMIVVGNDRVFAVDLSKS
jgi:hypothetical protein